MSSTIRSYGVRQSKVTATTVAQAADALFRSGRAPTVRSVRERLGGGAFSVISPLLRAWWTELPHRLDPVPNPSDSGTNDIEQMIEALWLEAIEEARVRTRKASSTGASSLTETRSAAQPHQSNPLPSEAQVDARLQDKAQIIARLEADLAEFKILWRQACASRRSAERQADKLRAELVRLVIGSAISNHETSMPPRTPSKRKTSTRQHPQSPAASKDLKTARSGPKPKRTA